MLEAIYKAVLNYEPEKVKESVAQALKADVSPLTIVEELTKAIRNIGERFGTGEFFLPDLLMGAEAMEAGMEIVEPELLKRGEKTKEIGIVVLGAVMDDIHDIGKNIVATTLKANGFKVHDLGVNVPTERFIEEAERLKADIVGLSALMTTTIQRQKEVIDAFKERGIRDKYKIMVGGAAVTQKWADEIGADAYAPDAWQAVEKARNLVRR